MTVESDSLCGRQGGIVAHPPHNNQTRENVNKSFWGDILQDEAHP